MNDRTRTTHDGGSLELLIEELVLHGFPAGDRYAIADALQVELAKLVSDENFSLPIAVDIHLEFLDAGEFRVADRSRSGLVAGQVARALLGSMARGASRRETNLWLASPQSEVPAGDRGGVSSQMMSDSENK